MLASDAAAGPWSFCNTGQEEKGLGPPGVESGGRRLKLNLPQRDLPTHPDSAHKQVTCRESQRQEAWEGHLWESSRSQGLLSSLKGHSYLFRNRQVLAQYQEDHSSLENQRRNRLSWEEASSLLLISYKARMWERVAEMEGWPWEVNSLSIIILTSQFLL